ncbi:ion transporter [Plectonema cf. radiosum LEGE 06105]|uniref:Ion transporter n=1 Tax=Plectonema cf. radiosum LEGE 06105 TaxID=945769 RepID=A0A8J7K5B0_9CYAN|nr:ion channel [Plectonema radiosum]MBE9216937.1 ion transporter [Plectonema cf. radiosum LEGE 06105]
MQKPPKQNLNRWIKKCLKFFEKKQIIFQFIIIFIILIIFFWLIPSIIYPIELQEPINNDNKKIEDFWDGLWWTITTITTVGYGDKYPTTPTGKLIAVVVMLVGTVALEFSRLLIFSILIDKKIQGKIQEALGIGSYDDENHIIICEYNHRINQIVKELRKNPETRKTPVVLIADIERNPINDDNFHFIKGPINPGNLKKANLTQAKTVIILGDHQLSPENRDYKAILACFNVKKINSEVYIILEIADETHLETYKGVANEMIVSGKLSSLLISNAVINHNISEVIFDILTYEYGSEIQKIRVSKDQVDSRFIEVFMDIKRNEQKTVIAIETTVIDAEKVERREIITNPSPNYKLKADDYLIVIATEINSSK